MPNFPLVDTHVHFIDTSRHRYAELERTAPPSLLKNYLLEDFDRLRGGVDVESMLFLEVAVADEDQVREVAFGDDLARSDSRIKGMVAAALVEKGAGVEQQLDEIAKHDLVRGIRRLIQNQPDPEFCTQPDFIEGVRRVAQYGWHFEICVYHHQLGAALELARRCPDVTLLLDHIGKPGIAHDLVEPWWSQIKSLARMPNVHCKVSGVITEADHERWTESHIKPYLDRVFDVFGIDRVMFGSDWPVSELTHRYRDWVEILDRFTIAFTDEERRKFFRENANTFYRLG